MQNPGIFSEIIHLLSQLSPQELSAVHAHIETLIDNPVHDRRIVQIGESPAGKITATYADGSSVSYPTQLLLQAFTSSPVAMAVQTPEDGFVAVNDRYLELYELTREQIIGRFARDTNTWAYPEEYRTIIGKLLEVGNLDAEECYGRSTSGRIFPILLSIETIMIDDKLHYLVIIQDISDRKDLQKQLLDANAELEQRVMQRTQELSDAIERASHADNMKLRFLASVSHELRTPLNAILNFTEFVQLGMLGPVNDRQVEALAKVLNSSRHLLSLVNDVLDISKIESGSLQFVMNDNVNLNTVIAEALVTARGLVKDKPVLALANVDQPLPRVRCDQRRIQQVMLNLVSNACKFTEAGRVTIDAFCTDSEVIISVADTGPGILLEDREAIFEPFYQATAGIRKGGGTGLGLSISRHLIEAHGGRIWVESVIDEGSTFYFSLPLSKAAE